MGGVSKQSLEQVTASSDFRVKDNAAGGIGGYAPPSGPPSPPSSNSSGGDGSEPLSSKFNRVAWDKQQVSFAVDGKEVTYTSGIAAEKRLVEEHGHNSRFSTWAARDAVTGEKLGKTTIVTTPDGKEYKRSDGWTGTKSSFEDALKKKPMGD